ncbi:hypothetical protein AB1Y20_006617 [Prymnesium parvum]|uniref:Calponin-homology (CH) domain-containing protein n=1 Tax=Prymnesium parvum TaxID=97485 RepID=A0AB34IYL7_PRYPA
MAAASLAAAAYPERGRRRPAWALLHWVNTLVRRQRQAHDLHLVFTDGLTLCTVLERLHPAAELVRFRRAATRGPALSNIEQALALVWRFSPQASAMPSADQVLDGSPRDLLLRFISELYTLFVVRPARARMRVALPWLQQFLTPYGLEVSQATYAPPHKGLGADFRSGTALACALHALLPPARTAGLDGAIYGCPSNESERAKTIRAVFAILEAERLAPCR